MSKYRLALIIFVVYAGFTGSYVAGTAIWDYSPEAPDAPVTFGERPEVLGLPAVWLAPPRYERRPVPPSPSAPAPVDDVVDDQNRGTEWPGDDPPPVRPYAPPSQPEQEVQPPDSGAAPPPAEDPTTTTD